MEFLRVRVFAAVLSALFAGACSGATPSVDSSTQADTTLAVPGRSNAHVSLAADGMFVAVVWAASQADGAADVYAATSRDGGVTFSPAVLASGDVRVHASGEQPPRVALVPRAGREPAIVVAWVTRNDAGTALAVARSEDAGATFGPGSIVAGSVAAGNRGWQAVAAGPGEEVAVAWLDHRRLADQDQAVRSVHQHGGSSDADPEAASVAMAQLSQLYFTRLGDRESARALTGGVCYCCKTAMAVGTSGVVSMAWRHVYDGNMRDIAYIRSGDGGRTFGVPVRISEDRWSVAGCPDDGPALALDDSDRVHVVWPTVVSEEGEPRKALFHAMSSDGVTFTPRAAIPTEGHASHPQVAVGGGGLAVIWDEAVDGTRRIASARGVVGPGEGVRFEREDSAGAEGVYPAVVFTADGGLVRAWTSGPPQSSVIRVSRLRD
jgi:hypothetical protein